MTTENKQPESRSWQVFIIFLTAIVGGVITFFNNRLSSVSPPKTTSGDPSPGAVPDFWNAASLHYLVQFAQVGAIILVILLVLKVLDIFDFLDMF